MGSPGGMGGSSRDPFYGSGDNYRARRIQSPGMIQALSPRAPMTRPDLFKGLRSDESREYSNKSKESAGHTRTLLGFIFCALALTIGLMALKASPVIKIGPYGLIQAFSLWYYVAIAILVLSFAWVLPTEKYRSLLLSAHLAVFVMLLHGAPGVIESAPRFPMAWVTTDFTDYIANTGNLLPGLDARFCWPAFFAASALLDKAAGIDTALELVRWWPVALNLLYLPLIFRIAKVFLRSDHEAWIATAIFPVANWIGQDYYSPQSVSYLLYLTFFYILIGPLGANDAPLWRSFRRPQGHKYGSAAESQQSGRETPSIAREQKNPRAFGFYLGLLTLLMAAMAAGHQLTPIVATATAFVLVLAGRTRIRWIVIAFALMTVAWICYGAEAFWSGHESMLIGGVGSLTGNVSGSVAARVVGNAPHEFVVHIRLLTSGIVWLLAILGALLWRPRNGYLAALVLCFLVSFGILAGGDYGGEGMLRVFLFGLPPAVCLIAALISKLRWTYRQIALIAVLSLMVPFFLVSRWGNELFEMIRPNEVTAAGVLYHIAKPGSNLVTVVQVAETNSPDELITEFPSVKGFNSITLNLTQLGPGVMAEIVDAASANPKGGYLVISTSQVDYAWLNYNWPPTWGATMEKELSQSPHFKLRYSNPDAEIFQYIPGRGSK